MSEWLAWAETVIAGDRSLNSADVPSLDPWLKGGHRLVADLRAAMHGEIDPRSLDEAEVREWQEVAWKLNPLLVAEGKPSVTSWLDQPGSDAIVSLVASGNKDEPMRPQTPPPKLSPTPALDAGGWRKEASLVALNEFEPVAELTLQQTAKQLLGLGFSDPLPDSQLASLSITRLGYAMRNLELQRVRNARDEKPGDTFSALVDERGKDDNYPHPGLDRWLITLFLEIIDNPDTLKEILGEMPGAPTDVRQESVKLVIADFPEMDETEMSRLLLCGYLLHRAVETRPMIFGWSSDDAEHPPPPPPATRWVRARRAFAGEVAMKPPQRQALREVLRRYRQREDTEPGSVTAKVKLGDEGHLAVRLSWDYIEEAEAEAARLAGSAELTIDEEGSVITAYDSREVG